MGNKQSLKELQERLARRLSAARVEGSAGSWLAVEAAGERFLLPLVQSGEIFPWVAAQRVPYTKPWYQGVVSLRGGLWGVVDLAALLKEHRSRGMPETRANDRVVSEARLISLHPGLGVNAVLLVDRLLGLRNPSVFASRTEATESAPPYYGQRLVDKDNLTWQELDMVSLCSQPAFLAIAA